MSKESRSQYFEAYAAIMKITLRDGEVSDDEKSFLQHFGKKLGVTPQEYFELIENDLYMSYDISAPYLYNDRLESLYHISKIVHEDDLTINIKEKWLKRVAVAIGFDPSNVKYTVGKSIDLFKTHNDLSLETFKDGIKNIMM